MILSQLRRRLVRTAAGDTGEAAGGGGGGGLDAETGAVATATAGAEAGAAAPEDGETKVPTVAEADLRVGAWNVHAFLDAPIEQIAQAIQKRGLDIVGLEESTNRGKPGSDGKAGTLARTLGMHLVHSPASIGFGLAVLSKFPISHHKVSRIKCAKYGGEVRALLTAVIQAPCGPITFCVTHLDHRLEPARLAQWTEVQALIGRMPHIIVGDLNALHRADYGESEWNRIKADRKHWEPPQSELMNLILGAQGYKDAATADARHKFQPNTCSYKTRIDYILASATCPVQFVSNTYDSTWPAEGRRFLSDHALVSVVVKCRAYGTALAGPEVSPEVLAQSPASTPAADEDCT